MTKRKRFGISKSLSDSLSHTVQAVANNAGSLRYEVVPLSRVILDPDNPRDMLLTMEDLPDGPRSGEKDYARKQQEKASLQSLSLSIKNQGIINPVWLYKHGENYRLAAGERRVLASLMAERDDIPAKILSNKPSDVDLRLIQWFENIERSDLSLWERLCNLQLILQAHQAHSHDEVTPSTVKAWLGCSLPRAMQYHAVVFAPAAIQDAVQARKINSLEKAAIVTQHSEAPWFSELMTACLEGASLKKLQQMVLGYRQGASQARVRSDTRGRKAQRVQLGTTSNTAIVHALVKGVLDNPKFSAYGRQFESINWDDYQSATLGFKKLIALLEQAHRR